MMSEERDYMLTIVSGKKRIGKTYRTAREVESYVMNDPSIGRKGQKVIILDTQLEDEWSKYPSISYDASEENEYKRCANLIKFSQASNPEVRRIIPRLPNRTPMNSNQLIQVIKDIGRYVRKCLLVLEDINKIIQNSSQQNLLTDLLISTRHIQIDVIMHYQSLAAVPPKMFQNAEIIRFHKQADPVSRYKDRIPYYTVMQLAEITVDRIYKSGNQYYFLYVSPTEEKLYELPYAEFEITCQEYLLKNRRILRDYLESIDLDGNKRFSTQKEAIKAWTEENKHFWAEN